MTSPIEIINILKKIANDSGYELYFQDVDIDLE